MKNLLLALVLALGALPCGAQVFIGGNSMTAGASDIPAPGATNTFTLVQGGVQTCSGSTSCSLAVSSTGSGNLIVLAVTNVNGTADYLSSATGGGTWVVPAGCQLSNNSAGAVSGAYVLSSTSGTTSIALTLSATTTYHVAFLEYSRSGGASVLDGACATHNNSSNTTTPVGVAQTLTGTNDVIIQWLTSGGTSPTAIDGSYGNFIGANQGAWADLENTTSGTAPSYSGGSSAQSVSASLAFQ